MTFNNVDLSTYTRIGRYDLPEPTRTTAPTNSLLAQEVSAVTYNSDTDTLFVLGDGGTSIVQVSKTGQLIDSMTLAPGSSPQGTDFYDLEGLTYVGNGKFVMVEERDRQAVSFTYAPNTTLTRSSTQTVKLGTTIGNIGIEGISYDPLTNGFVAVKEKEPEGIFQTTIDFAAGTASNGSPTTVNSTDLFNPSILNLADFADVFALSNLPALSGQTDFSHLLVLSQESGKVVNIDRSGNISSTLTITADPTDTISVVDQQHEGVTIDKDGFLYITSENGGGDINHPQVWVYAPTQVAGTNQAPTAVLLNNSVNSITDTTNTAAPVKVADIAITDDGLGTNNLTVTGTDASFFEITNGALYLKAGTTLNLSTKPSYSVTVNVDDPTVGNTPDATTNFTLGVTAGTIAPSVIISETAPWSSGNSAVLADWFEVTNKGTSAVNITGWKMDDNSNAFASAVALNGITSIAAGESVIFIETSNLAATKATFLNTWFGANPPAGLQIGSYSGSGVGLSTGGDAVNLFDAAGNRITGINFGTSTTFRTFDNAAGLGSTTLPLPVVSALGTVGVNGAFLSSNGLETGSPGSLNSAIIGGTAAASVKEGNSVTNGKLTASGSLTVTDLDPSQSKFNTNVSAASGNLGSLTITDTGSFTYTVDNRAVQYLNAGQTKVDSFTVTSLDRSATKQIDITINGVTTGFTGVAAGDTTSNSAIIWTRTFDTATAAQPGVTENVTLQISTDAGFGTIAQSINSATRDASYDYTLKLNATGLQSNTKYYYRFQAGTGEFSQVGTFKTTPAATVAAPVKFAFSGDMDGLMRPYALSSVVPSENLDFFVNLGDVIYENASNVAGNNDASWLNSPSVTLSGSAANLNGVPVAGTTFATSQQLFTDYNKKYLEQFLPVNTGGQNGLKDFYAGQANYTVNDNHELGNRQYINGGAPAGGSVGGATGTDMPTGRGVDARSNGTGNVGNVNDAADLLTPSQLASLGGFINKSQGYQTLQQTYLNYQPIQENRANPSLPSATIIAPADPRTDGTKQLYFAQSWGTNAVYIQTDTRSYRDLRLKTATGSADDTGARADNPDRTYLGDTQLAWLKQQLLTAQQSGTPWKFITLSDPIDQLGPIGGALSGTLTSVNSDGGKSYMGGYRAERNDLLKFIADNQIKNVVFLSADDHQNRINELYYSPTGQTGVQSSYVQVPNALSIVDGPLGATGPDTITNHTFANVKAIADSLANAQTAANINPIGLEATYPGLHDVKREQNGVLVNETTPQAADFYSPDTFNYNILEVSPDGKTLTVASKGINSTAQNSAKEYDASGNPVRTLFSFQIDGALNIINGTSGRDNLTGTNGNDRIIGGVGGDTLVGGGGSDEFVYTSSRDAGDLILDFTVGQDKLVFTQLLDSIVSGGYNGTNAIADGYIRVVGTSSPNTFSVQLDTDGAGAAATFRSFISVQGDGLTLASLNNASNFVF